MSPKHAIDCFLRTDMDALILNNFMIKKIIFLNDCFIFIDVK